MYLSEINFSMIAARVAGGEMAIGDRKNMIYLSYSRRMPHE